MEEQAMKKKKGAGVCHECEAEGLATTTETRRYTLAGGWSVSVEGAQVNRCPACGYEGVGFDATGGIERAVAEQVIAKPAHLAGEEIIFLRELLDYNGRQMAKLLGIGAPTLSRWENGHETITGPTDRLLRALVAARLGWGGAAAAKRFEAVLESIEDKKAAPMKIRVRMSGSDGHWKVAA
jgi:putative zinc finger/helix-turn-helix YgiT family protein